MKHINLLPLDSHGVDFSRVRMLNLNNWSRYYRQTLLFSALQDPQINSVFNKHCFNYMGQVSSQVSWKLPLKCWRKGGGEEQKTQRVGKFHSSAVEGLSVCQSYPLPKDFSLNLHDAAWQLLVPCQRHEELLFLQQYLFDPPLSQVVVSGHKSDFIFS